MRWPGGAGKPLEISLPKHLRTVTTHVRRIYEPSGEVVGPSLCVLHSDYPTGRVPQPGKGIRQSGRQIQRTCGRWPPLEIEVAILAGAVVPVSEVQAEHDRVLLLCRLCHRPVVEYLDPRTEQQHRHEFLLLPSPQRQLRQCPPLGR